MARRRWLGGSVEPEGSAQSPNKLPANALRRPGNNGDDPAVSLTASGYRVTRKDADALRRLVQPTSARSFAYYDLLGEIKYASQFYARMLAPLELFVAIKDEEGDLVPTEEPDIVAALDRIQDPGGGREGLLSAYGRLMFLVGEAMMFVSTDEETGEEQWEMLSTDEIRVQGNIIMRNRAPSLMQEEFHEVAEESDQEEAWVPVDPDTAVVYRLWQRHPRFSMIADSTMFGVLDLCEELILLTQAVRARARSRMAGSGLLFIDERVSAKPPEPAPDEDPVEDVFMSRFTEAMTLPIVDEGAASAVVPAVTRVPVPDGMKLSDMVYHLQIIDPMQTYPETGLRYECIKRIALGLDMPPEILLGLEAANHWTAWMVDEQTWKAHGQPKAQQLCNDLTQAYLRPYLRDVLGKANWMDFQVHYDATAIINHPDRTKDAFELYDKRIIGKPALREVAGFDEADAMTKDELAEAIGVAVRDSSLAWYGEPAPRGGTVETEPGVIEGVQNPDGGGGGGNPGTGKTGADATPGPPQQQPDPNDGSVTGALVTRIMAAADLAVLRSRDMAGSRLRSLARRDKSGVATAKIDGCRAHTVASILGRQAVRELRAPSELELVQGAHDLVTDALRMWNLNGYDEITDLLAAHVEKYAAQTLYDLHPAPFPPSFATYVAGLVATINRTK